MSYYTIHGITNTISGGASDINEKVSNVSTSDITTEAVEQIENTISNLRAQINRTANAVNKYDKLPAQLNALTSVVNSIRANTFKLATTRDYSAERTNVYNTQYINNYLDTNTPKVWDDTNRLLEATDKDVYSATYIQNIPNISAIPTVYENSSKTIKTLRDPLVYSVSVVDEIAARTPKYHYVKYSDNDNSTAVYNTSYINSLPIPDSLLSRYNPNPRTNDVYTAKYINNEIEARIPKLVNGPGDVIDPDKNGYTAGYINSLHIPSNILYAHDTHESISYNYDSTLNDVYDTYYIDRLLNVHTFTDNQSTTYTENALMVKLYDDSLHKQEISGKRRIQMYGHTAQTYMFRPTSNALSIEYFAGDFLPDAEGTSLMQITNTGALTFKNLVVGDYLELNNSDEDIVMVTRDISTSLTVKDYFGLSQNHNPYALIQRHVYRDTDTSTTHFDINLIEGNNVYHPIAMTNSTININSTLVANNTLTLNNKLTVNADEEVNGKLIINYTDADKDQQIQFTHGTDFAKIRFYDGTLEFATAVSEVKLLDENGNTSFSGNVTAPQFVATDTMKVLTPSENTTSIAIGNEETTNNSAVITYHNDTSPHSVTIGFTNNEDILTVKADGTAHAPNLAYKDVSTIHYYFTALSAQSLSKTDCYKAYKLGYIQIASDASNVFAGTIDVTINCSNNTSESFRVTLKYSADLNIDGTSFNTNSLGQGALALIRSTENANVYTIYVLSTGYSTVDNVGFQVRCYMPEDLKLYANEECTTEQNQERYASDITEMPLTTLFTDIYWNSDAHALKSHSHDTTYTRIDSLATPNSQPTATLTYTKSIEEDVNVIFSQDTLDPLVYHITPNSDYTVYINNTVMSSQQITLNGLSITHANSSLTFSASAVLDVSFTIMIQRNGSDLRNKYWFTFNSTLPQNTTYTLNTTSEEGQVIATYVTQACIHTHTQLDNDLEIKGELTTTGDMHCGGMITQTSDRTMKQNIEPLKNNVIDNVRTYKFTFKNDLTNHIHYGVIAQELQEICPELVHEDSKTHKLSVNYIELIPHLVQKIQHQTAYIHRQTGAIAVLFIIFIVFVLYYFLH